MSLRAVETSGVKVYNLTAGVSFPSWLSPAQRRELSRSSRYADSIMLLQDLEFPATSQRMQLTRDQRNLFICGTYRPSVKCYQLDELAMKVKRESVVTLSSLILHSLTLV